MGHQDILVDVYRELHLERVGSDDLDTLVDTFDMECLEPVVGSDKDHLDIYVQGKKVDCKGHR